MSKAGARVTAVDQSEGGIAAARAACAEFPEFEAKRLDLLEPLGMAATFDLVWSYGVVHHTGDTRRALLNVAECVKKGGLLFLMIYGEPRWEHVGDFEEVTSYIDMRRKLASLDFDRRVELLRSEKSADVVQGWFDAASPKINDLHRLDEIAEWLHPLGFVDVKTTVAQRNLHLIARRV